MVSGVLPGLELLHIGDFRPAGVGGPELVEAFEGSVGSGLLRGGSSAVYFARLEAVVH